MYIVIFILKFIGVLLAVLVGVLLAAVCYLLFAPVTYRGRAARETAFSADFSLQDPLRLVQVKGVFAQGGQKSLAIRLLWGLLGKEKRSGGDDGTSEGQELNQSSMIVAGEKDVLSTDEAEEAGHLTDTDGSPDTPNDDSVPEDKGFGRADGAGKDGQVIREPDQTMREPREPDESITEPIPPKEIGTGGARKAAPGRMGQLERLLSHPGNKRAFALLWTGGIRLLRRIQPHIREADMMFATGEPDWTGELVGALSVLPIVYDEHVRLAPDFESSRAYATGHIDLSGRIQLFGFAAFGLRVIASRDCRRLYRQARRLTG